MTSKLLSYLIVSLLIAGTTCFVVAAQRRRTTQKFPSIHASRLNTGNVVGALGYPLGEVVTVEGIAADETYTRRKADTGKILLLVHRVNGKPIKREVVLPCQPHEGVELTRPTAGARFKFVGYETGGFSGTPEEAFVYIPRTATSGYYFTTSLVILRDDSVSISSMKTVQKK
jgi:hypothetical protein